MKKTAITYGTFDMFHIGHLRLLQRLRSMADELIVGVSTEDFNEIKMSLGKLLSVPREDIIRALDVLELLQRDLE